MTTPIEFSSSHGDIHISTLAGLIHFGPRISLVALLRSEDERLEGLAQTLRELVEMMRDRRV
jgi:hypothetical protein